LRLLLLQNDFAAHLARKGMLLDADTADRERRTARHDAFGDVDWVRLTGPTQAAFADELAAVFNSRRVQRWI
jgi:hypothetical protein